MKLNGHDYHGTTSNLTAFTFTWKGIYNAVSPNPWMVCQLPHLPPSMRSPINPNHEVRAFLPESLSDLNVHQDIRYALSKQN